MKNNKTIIFSIILIGLILVSVNAGWCVDQTPPAATADVVMKTSSIASTLKKFAFAMGGVLISLIVVWFGLNIFKKITLANRSTTTDLYNDGLTSPKTVDEAISFFINKNRLK